MKHFPVILLLFFFGSMASAQKVKPEATEDWTNRPDVVTPGQSGSAPSDAIVLFANETDLTRWTKADGTPAAWEVKNNVMRIVKDAGDIQTKQKFGSVQLHIEWMTPDPA